MLTATVSRILPFSCVDGPGNRLVLFLQGCNFRCPTCHNPHTIGLCNDCGDCVATCPNGALQWRQGRVHWLTERCTDCDRCLTVCPRSANPKVSEMSVAQVLMLVRRYSPMLTGVTVSGGEATRQLPFLVALFSAIKEAPDLAHLSCLVDSNGALSEPGWQRLLPFVDGAMIDLKAWHSDCHRRLTGQDNVRVLASLQLLAKAGKLAELRLLYVPGQSDFIDERGDVNPALLAFLHQLASPTIRLNGFRHHGVKGVARTWQQAQQEELAALADALTAQGLGPIIQPVLFA